MTLVDDLRAQFDTQLGRASSDDDLKALRDQYLGRKGGAIASLMKAVASASPEERPALGRLANELKTYIEETIAARRSALESSRPASRRGRRHAARPAGCRRPSASADGIA